MSLNSMLLRGTAASKPSTSTFAYQLYIETDGSQIIWQGDSSLVWKEIARVKTAFISISKWGTE